MTVNGKAWPYPTDLCQVRNAWDAGLVVYQGFSSDPAATDADAKWVIMKLHYDVSNQLTGIDFADSDDSPNKVWDDRASYTYQLDT